MKIFLLQIKSLIRISFLELWRRNDIFGLLILGLALMVPLSLVSPFGASGATRYLDEVALLLTWAFSFFIALGSGARLFPPEFESRTIYPLLSKPISRGRLLFGKYLGAVASAWSALAFFYVLFLVSTMCRGVPVSLELAQGILLHFAFVVVVVSISLLGSLLMSPSANLTLCSVLVVGMYFFGRRLPIYAEAVGSPFSWIVRLSYAVAPHAEFFDMRQRMIHNWGGVGAGVLFAVLVYAVIYAGGCLVLASFVLKRKRL